MFRGHGGGSAHAALTRGRPAPVRAAPRRRWPNWTPASSHGSRVCEMLPCRSARKVTAMAFKRTRRVHDQLGTGVLAGLLERGEIRRRQDRRGPASGHEATVSPSVTVWIGREAPSVQERMEVDSVQRSPALDRSTSVGPLPELMASGSSTGRASGVSVCGVESRTRLREGVDGHQGWSRGSPPRRARCR